MNVSVNSWPVPPAVWVVMDDQPVTEPVGVKGIELPVTVTVVTATN